MNPEVVLEILTLMNELSQRLITQTQSSQRDLHFIETKEEPSLLREKAQNRLLNTMIVVVIV